MTSPRVDVLVPVYNGEATVREAIRSLQDQTYGNLRIIIVDDGSTDATPDILADIAASDVRLHVVIRANAGAVNARNFGLTIASENLLAQQDADDLSDPDRIAKQVSYLDEHPSCVAVSGAARDIDAAGQPTGAIGRHPPVSTADPTWVPGREPYLKHPFLTVRRSAMQTIGGYRHVLLAEDADLYWRLRRVGDLHNLNDVLGSYRVHAGSVSGASVLNGRVMALYSQLGALSAVRAEQGKADLNFEAERGEMVMSARSMSAMFDLVAPELTEPEVAHLRVSFAAKLLALAHFRPYEPDIDDCRFVREAYRRRQPLRSENERELRWLCTTTAVRLASKGLVREALQLLPLQLYPEALARAVLGRAA